MGVTHAFIYQVSTSPSLTLQTAEMYGRAKRVQTPALVELTQENSARVYFDP